MKPTKEMVDRYGLEGAEEMIEKLEAAISKTRMVNPDLAKKFENAVKDESTLNEIVDGAVKELEKKQSKLKIDPNLVAMVAMIAFNVFVRFLIYKKFK